MQFKIDNSSDRPVYQQLMDQIKRQIAMGLLRQGEKLPTVRQLAASLVINPNTIAKAYKQLEREGIITTRPGAGAFVTDLSSNLSSSVKKKIITEQLERVIIEARHMDLNKKTLSEWFDKAIEKFKLKK